MDYQSVLSEVESWPVEDRIKLVHDVSDRLADQADSLELTDKMKAELDRRIDELDRNPESGVPWEVVKARALERFRNLKGEPRSWKLKTPPRPRRNPASFA